MKEKLVNTIAVVGVVLALFAMNMAPADALDAIDVVSSDPSSDVRVELCDTLSAAPNLADAAVELSIWAAVGARSLDPSFAEVLGSLDLNVGVVGDPFVGESTEQFDLVWAVIDSGSLNAPTPSFDVFIRCEAASPSARVLVEGEPPSGSDLLGMVDSSPLPNKRWPA